MLRPRRLPLPRVLAAVVCAASGSAPAVAFGANAPLQIDSPPKKPGKTPQSTDPCGKANAADSANDATGHDCDPGLEIGLSFASSYLFRGLNVFQTEHQADQTWVMKPRVVWTDPSDRFSIGYAAAYQLGGADLWENIDAGLGSDQIFFADYDFHPAPRWVVSPELGAYLYPQASSFPFLMEASAEASYEGPVQVGAYLGYLYAIRPTPLPDNYLYFSPRIEKDLQLTARLNLDFYFSAGIKLFRTQSGPEAGDNLVDLLTVETLRYDLTDDVYVSLKWALAWTNFDTHTDPQTGDTVQGGFVQGFAPYWGFAVGAEL